MCEPEHDQAKPLKEAKIEHKCCKEAKSLESVANHTVSLHCLPGVFLPWVLRVALNLRLLDELIEKQWDSCLQDCHDSSPDKPSKVVFLVFDSVDPFVNAVRHIQV